jgi:hypothetical protein
MPQNERTSKRERVPVPAVAKAYSDYMKVTRGNPSYMSFEQYQRNLTRTFTPDKPGPGHFSGSEVILGHPRTKR